MRKQRRGVCVYVSYGDKTEEGDASKILFFQEFSQVRRSRVTAMWAVTMEMELFLHLLNPRRL